ncbi:MULTISPECIES: DUF2188 domain-containing protein [Bacillota]|uniref:DUF2188 domain-containing protein n=1 Tax=Virgibacillus pantothenticus TaxID=1473 RepID=A0A0L0QN20_VIRPA|nr:MULTISPECIES: DUF2188 domain-containing protein [Bacillota]KNE19633.1 hypothetical protein AFK71_14305 [Virgibacillus pantothenticus]MBU8567545.1 DUF2188 domain-containing protein [Virgibacillus pantothenticus]MBU8601333.1 DUF2188 domain-containing protein [Virgibacillus pantothenticus]MBU8636150.1 DUF2188 domain-containing protein [Virgibacillus pantothenticus]MBU8643670.1 DUF2188 domain-containing protein [Virgibacillus pantothenticus]
MRTYSVTPNVDATGWFVKLEDVAPEELYEAKDDAIKAAEQMADENRPSKVQILDKFHQVLEEKRYK